MIIFLYGPDTYRSKQKLKEIIEHYKKIHKSGLNLRHFDFKEDTFEEFRDCFKSFSMFKEKKLIILTNVFSNSKIKNDFSNFLKDLSKSKEIILFYESEIDEKQPLFKKINQKGKSQKFELLEGNSLKNWIKKEFQKYSTPYQNKFGTGQARITPEALDLLISYVGNDLWQLENEIKKLVNFSNKKEVQNKDVELLIKPKIETDIFKTIDAIASKNKKEALSLIKDHLEKGDSPTYILAMINFQFRNLLMIKDQIERRSAYSYQPPRLAIINLSRKLRMHPFVIEKTLFQARKFKLEELRRIYQKIFQTDLDIKTGKTEPEAALETLLIEI